MRRPAAVILVVIVAVAGLGSCSSSSTTREGNTDGSDPTVTDRSGPNGQRITVSGHDALVWGDGPDGVVLAHGSAFDAASWAPQADEIAAQGATAIAVEDTASESIRAAVSYLRDEKGINHITLLGGSAGADSILTLVSEQPDLAQSLILLSPNRAVTGLGAEPKLFIASEGETVAHVSSELADSAPGEDNVALILPGSAHAQNLFDSDQAGTVTQVILDRLQTLAPA